MGEAGGGRERKRTRSTPTRPAYTASHLRFEGEGREGGRGTGAGANVKEEDKRRRGALRESGGAYAVSVCSAQGGYWWNIGGRGGGEKDKKMRPVANYGMRGPKAAGGRTMRAMEGHSAAACYAIAVSYYMDMDKLYIIRLSAPRASRTI